MTTTSSAGSDAIDAYGWHTSAVVIVGSRAVVRQQALIGARSLSEAPSAYDTAFWAMAEALAA